jgi:peroxiredoxin
VLFLSVYEFATHGVGTAGVTAGRRLHSFSAPLALSTLNGDANARPPCSAARHDPRALNVCLLVQQAPLVLAFFVAGSDSCVRQIDTLNRVSRSFSSREVLFAAVAVKAGHGETRALVRRHGWTIPVAYDRDGTVGELYGVAICPLIELVHRGGVVARRLIGERWIDAGRLARQVRALASGATP